MWEVEIYIQTDSIAPKTLKRKFGYRLECTTQSGKTHSRQETGEIEGTLHQATLTAINTALGRLNQSCTVHIYTEDRFICNMFASRLDGWARNGWKTSRGDEVENREEWETLWRLTKGQLARMVPGRHKYSDLLALEMQAGVTEAQSKEEKKDV